MKIILIGLPGCGKSTMGKALASRLDLPFFDLDSIIMTNTGKTVANLFSTGGEDYFRQLERSCLLDFLSTQGDYVLACGGGTPSYANNLAAMKSQARLVFLNTPLAEIHDRLLRDSGKQERPIFSNSDSIVDNLQKLQALRLPFYLQADIQFSGNDVAELAGLLAGG